MRGLAAGLVFSLIAGCTAVAPVSVSGPSSSSSTSTQQGTASSSVDPQIMRDVIEWAFPVGGDGMLRTMRLARAVSSIQAVDCGGEPFANLDYTGDREDQMLYPDLALIQAKGLANETGERPAGTRVGNDDPCRYKSLPSWPKVSDLTLGYWNDLTREVLNRGPVQAELTSAGRCLEDATGWNLVHRDVSKLEYFFVEVDKAVLEAGDVSDVRAHETTMKYSTIFATCAADYATAMQSGLEAERPGAIERNRELLTSLARELAKAGYVP